MTDLNRDGRLEWVRFDANQLEIRAPQFGGRRVLELDDSIVDVTERDVRADGFPVLRVRLYSGDRIDLDLYRLSVAAPSRPPGPPGPDGPCAGLSRTWHAPVALAWGTTAGDFDGDGRTDILATYGNRMIVFENDGDNSFRQVFLTTAAQAPPGAFVAVAAGDSDGDGQGEIIGVETSTLNQVFLFEAIGDDTYVQRNINISEPDFSGRLGPSRVMIADADGDGRREIIFDTSSVLDGSKLFIYEHSGVIGENRYTKVFVYETISYLFNFTVGDSDNDGNQEIVLAFGGFGGFPTYLRRLENTGDNSFEHKIIRPGGTGLILGPTVADADHDGLNEALFGAVVDNQGGLKVFEATGDDTYQLVFEEGGLTGNGFASAVGNLLCGPSPVVAVGTSEFNVDLWRFDGNSYGRVLAAPIITGGQNRTLHIGALDGDAKPDLLFATLGQNVIPVYEADTPPIVLGDLNCDGVLNGADIDPFFLALGDPAAYRVRFPNCDPLNGDINGDGALNGGDIDPFFQCLGGNCP
ncbi:MAG: VCBS repeat-containing protein [Planctomycetes bacterium]|nr:VCBS repeat-containing protein [Planctomycetota bacterium]